MSVGPVASTVKEFIEKELCLADETRARLLKYICTNAPTLTAAFLITKRVYHQDLQLVETEDMVTHIQMHPTVLASFHEGTVIHVRRKVCYSPHLCVFQLHPPAWVGQWTCSFNWWYSNEGTFLFTPIHHTQCKSNGSGIANSKGNSNGSDSAGANGTAVGTTFCILDLHTGSQDAAT